MASMPPLTSTLLDAALALSMLLPLEVSAPPPSAALTVPPASATSVAVKSPVPDSVPDRLNSPVWLVALLTSVASVATKTLRPVPAVSTLSWASVSTPALTLTWVASTGPDSVVMPLELSTPPPRPAPAVPPLSRYCPAVTVPLPETLPDSSCSWPTLTFSAPMLKSPPLISSVVVAGTAVAVVRLSVPALTVVVPG